MNYQETIQYIHQTPKFSRELGNRLLEKLLSLCGNPQQSLQCIHIAGTNGKGSTAVMLSEILKEAGYRIGLFTSPYIERFNERIQVNGTPIPDSALAETITKLRNLIETCDAPVSEFALDTAAAFLWFQQQSVDFVVLETGLGGRLDATNVIPKSLVSVITNIGLDHTQYLGNTLEEIATEKCGIIKEGSPLVVYPLQEKSVLETIQKCAAEKKAEVFVADIPWNGKAYTLGLQGEFQAYNAATVLKVIDVLRGFDISISETAVEEGLKNAHNPARFERFGEQIILDGAHNPQAIQALCQTLKSLEKPLYFCTAMMEDKDYLSCVKILKNYAKGIVVTEISMPRCCSKELLKETFFKQGMEEVMAVHSLKDAVETALTMAGEDGIVCICGSLYLAGELRPYLKNKKANQ
ncbi:MAG: bifunctional folylpolyglutamate synthase/dihydrofolate synthase [Clostridia bacterium]|nr:bifunctional folylpolyglutamate synthase/dihydrofolate synthase [Clostridia bacterium]